ncbi:MAG TPA: tRNA (adenosine(37)-N6)-threonylcarbamoyltransferase complex ATPase subunit type 1 TsaE [Chthoniobacterales bacterium]
MATFISNSPAETEAIAGEIAQQLRAGSVLALAGELGSGKTQFVKGVVASLGSAATVTSPTFTLIHEYPGGRVPVYHFDFFRLKDRQSADRLGLEEYFFGNGVCLVEWADRFPESIPPSARWIWFETKSENQRAITLK